MPEPKKSGRPATHRLRVVVRFTEAERDRLDSLRGSKARGVFLGKLLMAQPLSPFAKFISLKKK